MSGIEIAGIVLGTFPLIISAFEHSRSVAKAYKVISNWEEERSESLERVKDEQLAFRQGLKILLLPLVTEEVTAKGCLESLLADPGGPSWKDDNMDAALAERLDDAKDRYLVLIGDLQKATLSLLGSLGFDKPRAHEIITGNAHSSASQAAGANGASKLIAAANRYFQRRKTQLKFTLGKWSWDEELANIHVLNQKLQEMLNRSDKISQLQTTAVRTPSRQVNKALIQYARHAGRIYALVQASWTCSCKTQHCAHLWLHHPPPSKLNEFRMLMVFDARIVVQNGHAAWKPQALQITWYSGSAPDPQADAGLKPVAAVSAKGQKIDAETGGQSRPKKKVKFDVGAVLPAARRTSEATAKQSTGHNLAKTPCQPLGGQSAAASSQLQNLCRAMAHCGLVPSQLGALTDTADGATYLVSSQPGAGLPSNEVSLHQILQDQVKCRLHSRVERIRIALAIASAHLQLHSTPWARKQWEAADVLFPQDKHDPDIIMFDKPFVSADFNATVPSAGPVLKRHDRSFACLGVMLLELWFGFVLEDFKEWETLGFTSRKADPVIRLMVAGQRADSLAEDAGPEYAAAVLWSLRDSPTTLHGDDWRQNLADRVVTPLQRCWEWMRPNSSN